MHVVKRDETKRGAFGWATPTTASEAFVAVVAVARLGSRATRACSRRRSFGGVSAARRSYRRARFSIASGDVAPKRSAPHNPWLERQKVSSLVYQVVLVTKVHKNVREAIGGAVVIEMQTVLPWSRETKHFGQKMRQARSYSARAGEVASMMTTEMMTTTTATTTRAVAAMGQAVWEAEAIRQR